MKTSLPLLFLCCFSMACFRVQAQKLAAIPYVSGINAPIEVKNCGDDRLFLLERGGRIRVINADGTLRPTPFLDITAKISSPTAGEEGLLGLAFSPSYQTDGKFFVNYTGFISGQLTSFIQQYQVSAADSNIADPSTALTLLTQSQPFTNHKAGNLMFGKDGFLYISLGDGGSGGDPFKNGQNKKTFLAKILRIDIRNSSAAQPYVVPSSNPFYNDTTTDIKKEIWTYGVRNPFRCSVDRLTGDLLIADVGQNTVEEVDFQKASDPGGENYGWNIVEGDSCYDPAAGCDKAGITMPIYEYFHNGGGAAIIGGYVYRSVQSKALWGQYLFADEVLNYVKSFLLDSGQVSGNVNQLITSAGSPGNPVSFGEDLYGDQYIVFFGNDTVYKLVDTSYLRRPKAFFTPADQGNGSYTLEALQGKNLTYQWLLDNVPISGATVPDYTTAAFGSYTLAVTNALGFSDTSSAFIIGSSVTLTSLSAQKIPGNLIALQWQTSSELDIVGYTVQRRKDQEIDYSNIGFVNSKVINSFSVSTLEYAFTDSTVSPYSKIFYRLQIQHTDGSFTYSNVIFVSADITKNGFLVFPNPSKDFVQIYLNEYTQPVWIVLYDMAGKKILEQIITRQNAVIPLPASRGIYILQLSNQDGSNKVRKEVEVQ